MRVERKALKPNCIVPLCLAPPTIVVVSGKCYYLNLDWQKVCAMWLCACVMPKLGLVGIKPLLSCEYCSCVLSRVALLGCSGDGGAGARGHKSQFDCIQIKSPNRIRVRLISNERENPNIIWNLVAPFARLLPLPPLLRSPAEKKTTKIRKIELSQQQFFAYATNQNHCGSNYPSHWPASASTYCGLLAKAQ